MACQDREVAKEAHPKTSSGVRASKSGLTPRPSKRFYGPSWARMPPKTGVYCTSRTTAVLDTPCISGASGLVKVPRNKSSSPETLSRALKVATIALTWACSATSEASAAGP